MPRGIALVISAPSGSGKSTLSGMLLKEFPDFHYSVSCTTRAPRSGEEHGRDYFFISRDEFEVRRARGEFAEWAEVHGNYYGTPLRPVLERLDAGVNLLFDVDVQGAAQIRLNLTGAIFVFILPPDMAELERRLRLRGLDDNESIRRRLLNAKNEVREASWYDALILNDDLSQAYQRLRAVYIAATLAPARNSRLLNGWLAAPGGD